MIRLLLLPLIPAIISGLILWLYQRKQGYSSTVLLFQGILAFYAIFYLLLKFLLH